MVLSTFNWVLYSVAKVSVSLELHLIITFGAFDNTTEIFLKSSLPIITLQHGSG